ncbi:pyruvate dehydrogenase [acetyl-transferring]-phosphatase 1, mitochondrial-like [Notolabrus celidotus]|uniref:pyruvate dehydrogenase [acetyl-transferring]-phosphatase 1, mitochondrial-like n=1 Tax=Notolabrus celidotus TaxID=1203425 RepID=UPI0014904184|nr:pyruvate dehydrogenase [acetyl-transferring]-phosphatase 1, mitochondrial-like [Notolabrus celidotus]XP_034544099.1 pyruvate dehydrogenase [acetyl-transferring]-phosphatase 1, mitochondrial-like [Notolabrus celidotus]XP_034544107.1 pyruvate dehydrogenase [acetyl-transferring]-phosphatase 1, mitochondrial-like [Notolabrus celidotus]
MFGRTGALSGRCRFEFQRCRPLSSSVSPPELPRPHYPASSGSRKYRTGHGAGPMSSAQISQILKANECSHTLPRGPASHGVLGFHSNMLPSNHPGEDRRSSATCLPGRGGVLFGVFDGHAGLACAHTVCQRLFYYIAVATLPLRMLAELERAVEEERAVPPLLEWHKYPQDHSCPDGGATSFHSLRNYWQERLEDEDEEEEEDDEDEDAGKVTSALVNAFRRLDYDISVEAQVHLSMSSHRRMSLPGEGLSLSSPLRVALSGCTACVAHISNGVLHVANLGDSRAVLGVQESDGSWSAISLTNDHNAQNPDELQRILGEHPPSEWRTVVRHDRLLGLLLPFRAFGDVRFKWSAEMLNRVYETRPDVMSVGNEAVRSQPLHYLTPPYLSAKPEVIRHHIRPSDKFLVLATDGLWELMHRQTVVQLVGEQLTGLQQQGPIIPSVGMTLGSLQRLLLERKGRVLSVLEDQNATTHLLRHALGDDGYGSVAPNRLAKMLSLPTDLARRYRDDITITVIHLNELNL